jgi:hypothetical protein
VGRLRSLIAEPLLQFLLLGAALFALWRRVAPDGTPRRVLVPGSQVARIADEFRATWGREPQPPELAALVESAVLDEIAWREGRALGLDRDDPVIRRRVRQKLEVMTEESLAGPGPGDRELEAWVAAHPDGFRRPATVTFEQVLLAPGDGRGVDVEGRIAAIRAALARGEAARSLGERTLLPRGGDDVGLDLVGRDFGEGFADALGGLPEGEWTGPVASGIGLHLVRVSRRAPGALPPLDAIRGAASREFEADRRRRALDETYRRLRAEYEVVVEATPGPSEGER